MWLVLFERYGCKIKMYVPEKWMVLLKSVVSHPLLAPANISAGLQAAKEKDFHRQRQLSLTRPLFKTVWCCWVWTTFQCIFHPWPLLHTLKREKMKPNLVFLGKLRGRINPNGYFSSRSHKGWKKKGILMMNGYNQTIKCREKTWVIMGFVVIWFRPTPSASLGYIDGT